jgi:hypothetical protein
MAPNRPNAAPAAVQVNDHARAGGGGRRLATVITDFFLEPTERLTEQERALMSAMLLGLVETLADEIRVRLPQEIAERTEAPPAQIVDALRHARLLQTPKLIELLLRRTEEVRGQDSLHAAEGPLQAWTSDDVPSVAAAAMAVVLARAGATDRFGRPGLEINDCDAETAVALSYAVAAELATRAPGQEENLIAAAVDLLSRHDEGQRLHALEARLVLALEGAGKLDGQLLTWLATAGEVGLLAEALARLAGVSGEAAWTMLMPPFRSGDLGVLLRLAGKPREVAAAVMAALAVTVGPADPLTEIEAFEALSEADVASWRGILRQPPDFAHALNALTGRG